MRKGPDPTTPLGYTFWILCSMEMWERLAYYGLRVVVWIYVAQADEPGGLHWTQAEKGSLLLTWTLFQSVLPTFTGGLSDRYGYKQTIAVSITLKIIGYLLMAVMRDYWGFWLGIVFLATGTALFKPGIQGSLAHTMDPSNSSKGWGIFYWLVNVGGLIGGFLAGALREISWPAVFYGCAGIAAINYLMLFTYKELESGAEKTESFGRVMKRTLVNLVEPRLATWLLIMSGFWFMMYQLWDLHPNFITDWVNSASIARALPEFMATWVDHTERGLAVKQELLLNLNSFMIVCFMVPIAIASGRIKTLQAMIIGMTIAISSILVAGLTRNGWVFLFGVVLFSMGEMLTGPKKNEYLALIAPPGKKGLYLGYVNIPVGIGAGFGGWLASWLYGEWGEKAVLAERYLAQNGFYEARAKAWAALATPLADSPLLAHAASWFDSAGKVSRSAAYGIMSGYAGVDGEAATQLLWDTYAPWRVWLPIAAVGLASVVALIIFARRARRWADMNY